VAFLFGSDRPFIERGSAASKVLCEGVYGVIALSAATMTVTAASV
jgi:hypothetical protein